MNGVDWNYFDKFEFIIDKYMPSRGEGETMASQIVTAINRLIYKWYNDGDVFDNTYYLNGWCNDLSSYANWLYNNTTDDVCSILDNIINAETEDDYEFILKDLADKCLNEEFLKEFNKPKVGSIYNCDGDFRFEQPREEWD